MMSRTVLIAIAGALALAACGGDAWRSAGGASDRSGYDERDPAYRNMPGDGRSPTTLGQSVRDE